MTKIKHSSFAVAKDLSRYVKLLNHHINKYKATIDKLVKVSLVKPNLVKNTWVIKILEKKTSLKKSK